MDCPEVHAQADVLRYAAMALALNKTGRPMYFSMCNWGRGDVMDWGSDVGNSKRTDLDMND